MRRSHLFSVLSGALSSVYLAMHMATSMISKRLSPVLIWGWQKTLMLCRRCSAPGPHIT